MLTIGVVWNGQTLDRTFVEINKKDEISLAQLFCNFKVAPLLDSFSDLPLSVKVDVYVFLLPISLRLLRCFIVVTP